jgi:hypothetical protein
MNKTKATQKTKTGATEKGAHDPIISVATSWCAEHDVPTRVMPEHTMRLIESAGLLDHAIAEAGGRDKVPEAVLLYRELLHEAALATAMHGLKRAILGLYGEAGR